jgi:hypothetical protein
VEEDSRVVGALSSRRIVEFFVGLTVFFIVCPLLPVAPYLMVAFFFGSYSQMLHEVVHVIVFIASVVTAVFLVAFLPRRPRDYIFVEQLVAVNCALQGFVVEASVALWLQSHSTEVGTGPSFIAADIVYSVLFVATVFLLVAAWRLSAHHGRGMTLGISMMAVSLLGNLYVSAVSVYSLLVFSSYEMPLMESFPGLPIVLILPSAMSVSYLWKSKRTAPETRDQ